MECGVTSAATTDWGVCCAPAVPQELGQRALVSYMRSLFLQPNRAVFGNVAALPVADFALALGLSSAPQLRFLKRAKPGNGAAAVGAPAAAAAAAQGDGELGVRALDDAEDVSSGSGGGGSQEGMRDAEWKIGAEVMQQRRDSGAAAGGSVRRAAQEGFREGVQDGRHAKSGNEGGPDAEDDFLVVKQRDVYDVAPDQAPAPAGVPNITPKDHAPNSSSCSCVRVLAASCLL